LAGDDVHDGRGSVGGSGELRAGRLPTHPPCRRRAIAAELEIAQLAAQFPNRDIGQRLYLSHRTVGSHLYRIFPKLGITSRRQLLGWCEADVAKSTVAA
jgi:DNA-binding CsgD family transcriptional regulator